MEIVTEREKPPATEVDDDAGTLLHAAAEVTRDIAGTMKESESDRLTESEVPESVTEASNAAEDPAAIAKTSDAMTVFEDAEDFGARFESFWNRCFRLFCAYDEITTIPTMCYTHGHDSDCDVIAMDNLQIYSIKVASINEGLHWPLQVFGIVTARDVLDRKRNFVFHRERDDCQTITEHDPYLTLTGPTRAVVVCDPVYVEVILKVKGATEAEDKELARIAVTYRLSSWISGLYPCELSTLELILGLMPSSVEATVHVRVTGGSWPDGFKGVFSAANARNEVVKVKLLDVGDDGLPVDAADGMIKLSRRVVSVEHRGMLKLFVSARSADGDEEERCVACFVPADAGVSSGAELKIGSCRMEATVAWSLFCHDY